MSGVTRAVLDEHLTEGSAKKLTDPVDPRKSFLMRSAGSSIALAASIAGNATGLDGLSFGVSGSRRESPSLTDP